NILCVKPQYGCDSSRRFLFRKARVFSQHLDKLSSTQTFVVFTEDNLSKCCEKTRAFLKRKRRDESQPY
ncbi:MAG: hypothetical protein QNJ74_26040, partial [Trichodesmium sp. MO_231.B1]|nr:hypothetical protein [Trichodesmium sp. MO_231.B1]